MAPPRWFHDSMRRVATGVLVVHGCSATRMHSESCWCATPVSTGRHHLSAALSTAIHPARSQARRLQQLCLQLISQLNLAAALHLFTNHQCCAAQLAQQKQIWMRCQNLRGGSAVKMHADGDMRSMTSACACLSLTLCSCRCLAGPEHSTKLG